MRPELLEREEKLRESKQRKNSLQLEISNLLSDKSNLYRIYTICNSEQKQVLVHFFDMRKAKTISMHCLEAVDNQQELYALKTIAELIVKISFSNSHEEKTNTIKKDIMNIEPQQKHKQL